MLAEKYGISIYDSALINIAASEKTPLITGDEKLCPLESSCRVFSGFCNIV